MKLGLQLGIEYHTLQKIDEDNMHNVDKCVIEMINWWLNDIEDRSYSKLITALVSIEERMAAEEVCSRKG